MFLFEAVGMLYYNFLIVKTLYFVTTWLSISHWKGIERVLYNNQKEDGNIHVLTKGYNKYEPTVYTD